MHEEKYTANGVIERGYKLYDQWKINKYNSRKIVSFAQNAVASMQENGTKGARTEALSYLFALDLRVKERYNSILRCLFLFLSFRRECALIKWMKSQFKAVSGEDVRELIEVEIERIREAIDTDKTDESDRKKRGGKVNELPGSEQASPEREMQENSSAKEADTARLDSKKETEDDAELGGQEQADIQTVQKSREATRERLEISVETDVIAQDVSRKEKATKQQESPQDYKIENNDLGKKPEPIANKNNEKKSYNNIIDSPTFDEVKPQEKDSVKMDFIDEVIIDNIIKDKVDAIGHNPLKDVKTEVTENRAREVVSQISEKAKDEKNSHLYDKMVMNAREESLQSKGNISQADVNNSSDLRVRIQVEDSLSMENEMRRSINDKFTDKMVALHKSRMEDALREELKIASEEYGINAPVQIVGEDRQSDRILGKK